MACQSYSSQITSDTQFSEKFVEKGHVIVFQKAWELQMLYSQMVWLYPHSETEDYFPVAELVSKLVEELTSITNLPPLLLITFPGKNSECENQRSILEKQGSKLGLQDVVFSTWGHLIVMQLVNTVSSLLRHISRTVFTGI